LAELALQFQVLTHSPLLVFSPAF